MFFEDCNFPTALPLFHAVTWPWSTDLRSSTSLSCTLLVPAHASHDTKRLQTTLCEAKASPGKHNYPCGHNKLIRAQPSRSPSKTMSCDKSSVFIKEHPWLNMAPPSKVSVGASCVDKGLHFPFSLPACPVVMLYQYKPPPREGDYARLAMIN